MRLGRGPGSAEIGRNMVLPPHQAEGSATSGPHYAARSASSATGGWLRPDLPSRPTPETLERRQLRASAIIDRGWLVRRALLLADILALLLAFGVVQFVFVVLKGDSTQFRALTELGLFVASIPFWVVAAKIYGLYDRDEERADATTADDLVGVLHVLTIGTWLVFAVASVSDLIYPYTAKFLVFWGCGITLVTLARACARSLSRRHPAYLQNTVILGAGDVGQLLAVKLRQQPGYKINVLGFIDASPKAPRPELRAVPLLGTLEDLPVLIRSLDIERAIIAFSGDSHEQTLDVMRLLHEFDLRVDIVPRLFELVPPSAEIHMLEGVTLIGLPRPKLGQSSALLKRTLDLVVTVPLLALFSPLLLAISLLIKLDTRGPVLFRQVRMGRGEKPFVILKFRTMVRDAEARKQDVAYLNKHARSGGDPRMFKIPDDPRLTRVGRVIRRYSLDELPQLFNVLRGDMSLVGPRPLILDEHQFVQDWGLRRLELKPGITGLWQVLGRDAISFEEMVRLDYFYVTTWSLWNDLRLLIRTFAVIAKGERSPSPTA